MQKHYLHMYVRWENKAYFTAGLLDDISAENYKNLTMLDHFTAKTVEGFLGRSVEFTDITLYSVVSIATSSDVFILTVHMTLMVVATMALSSRSGSPSCEQCFSILSGPSWDEMLEV